MSADTAAVRLQGLARTYRSDTGDVAAVAGLDLDVVPGSFTTLFGASGCGKTTTLRMVAGLERPDAGRVVLGPRTVFDAEDGTDVAPHRRGIGMVFQSFTVWPHLSVEDNVAYPLRAARVRRAPARAAAGEMLERVGLGGLGRRRTGALSGGQQQRVAIARALVHRPQVLLLDEPFSSLDGALRSELGADVRALQRDLGITVLYVTHDRIAVLDGGRLVQEGGPRELYDRPATRLVARALGTTNLLTVTAPPDALPDGTHVVTTSVGRLRASGPLPAAPDGLVVNVRAEDVVLLPRGAGDAGAAGDAHGTDNVLLGTVAEATYRGPNVDTVVRVDAGTVRVRTAVRPEPVVGDTVLLTFPVARTTLLADDPSA